MKRYGARTARGVLALGLGITALTACETGCIPTQTVAEDASIVVAPTVVRSGVFDATLTAQEKPLPSKKITFSVERLIFRGSRELGSETTARTGLASLDLKNRPLKLVTATTREDYRAAFAGDGTYCSSSDTATIDIARVR